jgi:AraC family transcriptional regulator of adaptative response/methylated-DNA-[protein]-cysteine methyltransferase
MQAMTERCQAYATVAEAIRYIRHNSPEQPGLEAIAAHVGLSPFHLQRTFSVWAGISPKRFLQFLTREHARTLLRQSRDVLAVAHATGLSGPSRVHDLMVVCDAVTPGEVGALGSGLEITYGFAPTPFGRVIAGLTPRGLCHLQFLADDDAALAALRADWPLAMLKRDDAALAALLAGLFAGVDAPQPLHLLLRGTNFQIKVWEALLRIPVGDAVSYGTLAGMIGAPRAPRAVGSAVARNRIAVLIPCHRVIRESGEIGEYRWGSERKNALLAYEAAITRG